MGKGYYIHSIIYYSYSLTLQGKVDSRNVDNLWKLGILNRLADSANIILSGYVVIPQG